MAVTSLPGLSSAFASNTKESTTQVATTTNSQGSTITSTSTGLPKLSNTASSSSSYATPTITPPSSEDNPYVSRSSLPSGTVFIAVGAVAGFIFLSFISFLFAKKIMAKRIAKKTLSLDSESSSDYGGNGGNGGGNGSTEKLSNPFYATSTNNGSAIKIPLLYEQSGAEKSMTDINEPFLKPEQNFYSTLDRDQQNKRKSMFVSPTAEVMNYNKNKSNSRLFVPGNNGGHSRDSSTVLGSFTDLRHSRMESFDTNSDVRITSPERSPQRGRGHRTVPSAYLESMFEDD